MESYKWSNIRCNIYSSNYGNKKVFGQPLKVRSGVVLEVISTNNLIGYGETYVSGYLPEISKITSRFDLGFSVPYDNIEKQIESIKTILECQYKEINKIAKALILFKKYS